MDDKSLEGREDGREGGREGEREGGRVLRAVPALLMSTSARCDLANALLDLYKGEGGREGGREGGVGRICGGVGGRSWEMRECGCQNDGLEEADMMRREGKEGGRERGREGGRIRSCC